MPVSFQFVDAKTEMYDLIKDIKDKRYHAVYDHFLWDRYRVRSWRSWR